MSQFLDSVKEKLTGNKRTLYEPLHVTFEKKDSEIAFFRTTNEYDLEK